jgi:hypothetical protein
MNKLDLYKVGYNFLLNQENVTEAILKRYLVSEFSKPNDITIIYQRFCESSQNRQMMTKVIGGSIGGVEKLSDVLFKFDPKKVSSKYSRNDKMVLLNDIKEKINISGKIRITNRSLWPQFCQSVIDSAYFLAKFETAKSFYEWADYFAKDSKSKPALPLMVSIEISGIGFPLACDILKEIGYLDFGKPDVHIKDIFTEVGLLEVEKKNQTKYDYEVLKKIDEIAVHNQVTSYAVDKVFWLIGSGNFYLEKNLKIGNKKAEFIKIVKGLNK